MSRLLLRMSMGNSLHSDPTTTANKDDAIISKGSLEVTPSMTKGVRLKRGGISWVSTELHLHATHNWGDRTVKEILLQGASFMFNADRSGEQPPVEDLDFDIASTAAQWLGLFDKGNDEVTNNSFLSRQFSTLSQGEQKLLLIASAIAQRPSLLVLDEPCQGLDLWNRGHILGLVEKICNNTDMSLLYVTHHEEELVPCIGHILCLDDGKVTYCGMR